MIMALPLAQQKPWVNGWSGLPRTDTEPSMRRSTSNEQQSGQSYVQAEMTAMGFP